jgi:hypothetical protein
MFVLHILTSFIRNSKKKIFCAFIDFKQAFDTVWRGGLWSKLLNANITGKCFNVINSMYKNIKSMVKINNCISDMFTTNIGVRQGENLSPFLFSLYINDLEQYLSENEVLGLETISKNLEESLSVYIKIFVLLYADDTVILTESAQDLQKALDHFHAYCNIWKLTVNVPKTQVIIFSRGRQPGAQHFYYNGEAINIVNELKYLGIMFSRTGSFHKAKICLCEKATKSMYSVIKKTRQLQLPLTLQLEMFDKLVSPVLLYGSEVWGYEKVDVIERVHLKFLKFILKVRSSTPTYMIMGELGRFPMIIYIKTRIINYWANIVCGKENKLCHILYRYLHTCFLNNVYVNPWLLCVKSILDECGLSNIWHIQSFPNPKWLKLVVNNRLKDQYIQNWSSITFSSSSSISFRIFKTEFKFEKYLSILSPKQRQVLVKLRLSNNRLPIITGQWTNVPRQERTCNLCKNNLIADEFHYLFVCKCFKEIRIKCLPLKYQNRPNCYKFSELMQSTNKTVLSNLSIFIKEIFSIACPPS